MIVDSDDEEPPPPSPTYEPYNDADFESEEEEFDPLEPYPSIVQTLDIPLNTEVLHISIPSIPTTSSRRSSGSIPPIFTQKLVVAVACADCTVRLVSLSLAPPSEASNPIRGGSQQIVNIGEKDAHHDIPTGVSMTWTSRQPLLPTSDVEMVKSDEDDDDAPSETLRRTSLPRRRSKSRAEAAAWDIVVASHSTELSGLLNIFRIPLVSQNDVHTISTAKITLFQTQCLNSPATKISFSPSIFPSKRHSQLLVVDSKGPVRIYDPLSPKRARLRPSPRDSEYQQLSATQGSWLASFFPNFDTTNPTSSTSPGSVRRKQVLGAQWALGGTSIIALLSDGEWGVWDMERVGPGAQGITGGGITKFDLRGFIAGAVPLTTSSAISTKNSGGGSKLAPMTPNTRRGTEKSLFAGPTNSAPGPIRGGISLATSSNPSTGNVDDSVIFWYGNNVFTIPSLMSFWQRSVQSKGRETGSLYGPGLKRLDGISFFGELNNGIEQFPAALTSLSLAAITVRDLLVTAEHRLIILITARNQPSQKRPLFATEPEETAVDEVDQQLLARGDLDLGGMDRLLDGMAGGSLERFDGPGNARRVGFAH
ncbi:hypothetical protein B0A49_02209 [Cryomyces minteri]|uniref:Nucleoporin NUP37 n=1 Tax=Cryomyces minteri TaxID=331657 RepID=A0A4U0XC99_9PEZI|nr:hypothetical protein B0A49_02209 [Cryomyces minteri]